MNTFAIRLLSPDADERLDTVEAFVGEDASGQFALRAGHERFLTVLVPGLARLRMADGRGDYLAQPGAVAHFADNALTLAGRAFLRGDDAERVSRDLETRLAAEEKTLHDVHEHLAQLEREMLRRLWRLQRQAP